MRKSFRFWGSELSMAKIDEEEHANVTALKLDGHGHLMGKQDFGLRGSLLRSAPSFLCLSKAPTILLCMYACR